MMAVESDHSGSLGSRLRAAVNGSGGVCLSTSGLHVSTSSSATTHDPHTTPPSPAPSCASSTSSSGGSINDGRGSNGLGRLSPAATNHMSGGEEDMIIDPVTTPTTTQATLTVSVHSQPASPHGRDDDDNVSRNGSSPKSEVDERIVIRRSATEIHDDSPPPSPLSPGVEDHCQIIRRSPTIKTMRKSPSPVVTGRVLEASSPPAVKHGQASQTDDERSRSPVVIAPSSNHRHPIYNHHHAQGHHHHHPAPGPVRLTNFSIDAILKAGFGNAATTRRERKPSTSSQSSSSSSSTTSPRALDVANLVSAASRAVHHYSPHGIEQLVAASHGHKYNSHALLQGVVGRTHGFLPYHPAAARRPTTTAASASSSRSPPVNGSSSPSPSSTSPSFTYPDTAAPGPVASSHPAATTVKSVTSSRHHLHHNPYTLVDHPIHHPSALHPAHLSPHHLTTTAHHHHHLPAVTNHSNHPHLHHHHRSPRSPSGLTTTSSSASSPAHSPGAASSVSSASSPTEASSSSSSGRSPHRYHHHSNHGKTVVVAPSAGELSPPGNDRLGAAVRGSAAAVHSAIRNGSSSGGGSGSSADGSSGSQSAAAPTTSSGTASGAQQQDGKDPLVWPAWVYCTRYSDRPSSGRRKRRSTQASTELADPWEGPRARKLKKEKAETAAQQKPAEKRPRTAFTNEQLARLKREFDENRYLTETRRQDLAKELGLNESQIKIWFQNKRAKMKKASGVRNGLAIQLMAQGLYNHSTVPCSGEEAGSDSGEMCSPTAVGQQS